MHFFVILLTSFLVTTSVPWPDTLPDPERTVAMAVMLLFVVALMVAAAVWAALPRLQDEPVRVRISEHPRRNSRR